MSSTAIGFEIGKFIPVMDMWCISPNIGYQMVTIGGGSRAGENMDITIGARF